MSIRLGLAVLALNLFALTLIDPAASSRPVRAEAAAEVKPPRIGRM
ncbi:MAG TPA: hypothetical protein VHG92_02400 [Afifellaceae bacterium]|nr:hypothetical protein [Afifellaceae bacterium]